MDSLSWRAFSADARRYTIANVHEAKMAGKTDDIGYAWLTDSFVVGERHVSEDIVSISTNITDNGVTVRLNVIHVGHRPGGAVGMSGRLTLTAYDFERFTLFDMVMERFPSYVMERLRLEKQAAIAGTNLTIVDLDMLSNESEEIKARQWF